MSWFIDRPNSTTASQPVGWEFSRSEAGEMEDGGHDERYSKGTLEKDSRNNGGGNCGVQGSEVSSQMAFLTIAAAIVWRWTPEIIVEILVTRVVNRGN